MNTWIIELVLDNLRLYNESDAELVEYYANRLAVDVLRKLGAMERPYAKQAILEHGGKVLADKIAQVYPHYWS